MRTEKITLNGKDIDAVIFGDGQEQIDLFNTVAAHVKEHKLEFKTYDNLTSRAKGMQKHLVIGINDQYEIRVSEEKFPGINNLFYHPRYFATIMNKETFKPAICHGTIAHYIWDLLNELKDKQK